MQDAFNAELKASIQAKCEADRWYAMKNGKMVRGKVAKEFDTMADKLQEALGDSAAPTIQQLRTMAAYAKEAYQKQAAEELQLDTLTLDTVFEMCIKEPWNSAKNYWELSTSVDSARYGYVTDRFAVAMMLFPEGSPQHEKFKSALIEATSLYKDQILSMAHAATRRISDQQCQDMRELLWHLSQRFDSEQSTRKLRLIDLAEAIGMYHLDQTMKLEKKSPRVIPDPDVMQEFQRKKPRPNLGDKPKPV